MIQVLHYDIDLVLYITATLKMKYVKMCIRWKSL